MFMIIMNYINFFMIYSKIRLGYNILIKSVLEYKVPFTDMLFYCIEANDLILNRNNFNMIAAFWKEISIMILLISTKYSLMNQCMRAKLDEKFGREFLLEKVKQILDPDNLKEENRPKEDKPDLKESNVSDSDSVKQAQAPQNLAQKGCPNRITVLNPQNSLPMHDNVGLIPNLMSNKIINFVNTHNFDSKINEEAVQKSKHENIPCTDIVEQENE